MTLTRTRILNAILHRGPGYQLPSQTETDLRAALTTLADRWEQFADVLTSHHPTEFYAEFTPYQREQAARARVHRQSVSAVREVLATGRIPNAWMTADEEEQYGTPEATS